MERFMLKVQKKGLYHGKVMVVNELILKLSVLKQGVDQ